jgi:hypothetical protein
MHNRAFDFLVDLEPEPVRAEPRSATPDHVLSYVRCWDRCLVNSNMGHLVLAEHLSELSRPEISRRFSGSCKLYDRM